MLWLLRGVRVRYWLTLATGLVECLCFAGVIGGWPSLVFILKASGYFSDQCVNATGLNGTEHISECDRLLLYLAMFYVRFCMLNKVTGWGKSREGGKQSSVHISKIILPYLPNLSFGHLIEFIQSSKLVSAAGILPVFPLKATYFAIFMGILPSSYVTPRGTGIACHLLTEKSTCSVIAWLCL